MKNSFLLSMLTVIVLTLTPTLLTEKTATLKTTSGENPVSFTDAKPIPAYLERGISWLADAQFANGGWGAGQHAHQDVRDPGQVQVDPATTAFAAMALLRTGSTLDDGPYSGHINKALHLLLDIVEKAPNGNNITDISGTQPQRKLGQNIDVAMATQFFTRVKPYVKDKKLLGRLDRATEICIEKLENSQNKDGSYAQGGWAADLQSSMATNALEQAQVVGYAVKADKISMAKQYQKDNVSLTSGEVRAESSAGISLYALAGTQRASAQEAKRVRRILEENSMKDSDSEDDIQRVLRQQGIEQEEAESLTSAYLVNTMASEKLKDDSVLTGFGNNGGEEYLSFMMKSESLLQSGQEDWDTWHAKLSNMLSALQNGNGSWSGHHCITSPVFCTAAVVLSLTADRDNNAWGEPSKD